MGRKSNAKWVKRAMTTLFYRSGGGAKAAKKRTIQKAEGSRLTRLFGQHRSFQRAIAKVA